MIITSPPSSTLKPNGGLYMASNQLNLVNGVWTYVTLNAVITNFTDGIENAGSNLIRPEVPGLYIVIANVVFTNVVADKEYSIRLNYAVSPSTGRTGYSLAATDFAMGLSVQKYFNGVQSIKLEAVSNAGVDTVDLKGGLTDTFLTVQRVR